MGLFSKTPENDMASKTLDALATHRKQQASMYSLKSTTEEMIKDLEEIIRDIQKINITIANITTNPRSTITDYNIQLTKLIAILNKIYVKTHKDELLEAFAKKVQELGNQLAKITEEIRRNQFKDTTEIARRVSESFHSATLQDIDTILQRNLVNQRDFLADTIKKIQQDARSA